MMRKQQVKQAIDYKRIAELYDTYVNSAFDIPFFLKEAGKVSGEVLELMSGTGRVSIPLIKAGVSLTCVDNSPEMLAVFRRNLELQKLKAAIYEMDVCKMSLGKKYNLVFMPFHSFAEILSPAGQRTALAAVRQHLSKTGHFICTLHNPVIRLRRVDGKKRLIGDFQLDKDQGRLRLWISERYDPVSHMVKGDQSYEISNEAGELESKMKLKIQFYMHTRSEFEDLAKREGLHAAAVYGDYDYSQFKEETSPFMIWFLQK